MNVSLPVSITPQETYSDLVLRFNPANASQPVSATLKLNTNASVFTVPIYAYTGKLKVSSVFVLGVNLTPMLQCLPFQSMPILAS